MIRRPSLTASIGPSTVRGFIAAMKIPLSDALNFYYPARGGLPTTATATGGWRSGRGAREDRLRRGPVVDVGTPDSVGPEHLSGDPEHEQRHPPDGRARH